MQPWAEAQIERHHERHHFGYSVPIDVCWYCQRNKAICRSKVPYTDPREAHEAAVGLNQTRGWVKPVSPYGCPHCGGWHLTSKPTGIRRRRWKKQQRKWTRYMGATD